MNVNVNDNADRCEVIDGEVNVNVDADADRCEVLMEK